jgi:hypothetical protein
MRPEPVKAPINFKDQIKRGPDWLESWKSEHAQVERKSSDDFIDKLESEMSSTSPEQRAAQGGTNSGTGVTRRS